MTDRNQRPHASFRSAEGSGVSSIERDGFVDEAVAMALVADRFSRRELPSATDLVLPADEADFASWCFPAPKPAENTRPVPVPAPPPHWSTHAPHAATPKRAALPTLSASRLDEPRRGQSRWWLTGLVGVASALLASVLVFTLNSRNARATENPHPFETLAPPPAPAAEAEAEIPSSAPDSRPTGDDVP